MGTGHAAPQGGGGGGAPTDAAYVVVSADGTLSGERVLTPGTNLSATDGGAGNNVTLDVDDAFLLNSGDTLTGTLSVQDDVDCEWGNGPDYAVRYDQTNTQFEFESKDIDGGGTTGTIWKAVDGEDAFIMTMAASAPADAALDNGQGVFSVDETNDELEYKVKYSGGTVKTGTVALS